MKSSVKKILVIGATNFPERIDPAILRSGRMDKRIFIPLPDTEAREELFKLSLEDRPCESNINYRELAKSTEGFMSSDVKLVVNNSALSLNPNEISKYLKF